MCWTFVSFKRGQVQDTYEKTTSRETTRERLLALLHFSLPFFDNKMMLWAARAAVEGETKSREDPIDILVLRQQVFT